MPLQIRRGTTAEVNSITPLIGELIYDTTNNRIVVGDGSTPGGTPIAGVTTNEAKDAAAASLIAGTHQNISFTYNSTTKALSAKVDILTHDTVEADSIITSKIFNSASSLILDVETGTLTGNVNGNISGIVTASAGSTLIGNTFGFHTGDVKGSIFATDDSSLLVDALDGVFYGDLIGNVTGNVVTVREDLRVEGTSNFVATTSGNILGISGHLNSGDPIQLTFRKSRGTELSPVIVQDNDIVGTVQFSAWDGTGYFGSSRIQCQVDGDPSSLGNIIPTEMRFFVTNQAGEEIEAMTLNRFGNIVNYPTNALTSAIRVFSSHSSTTDATSVDFFRSRGIRFAETALQNNDPIFDIRLRGHDGTLYPGGVDIRAIVDGAVSTGVVPGRLEIYNTDSVGAQITTLTVQAQKVTFGVMPVLPSFADETTANAAVGGLPVNGMMYYDTGASKIKGYQGGAWVVLQP